MAYDFDKGTNGIFSLHFHFVTCVKYRKPVFEREDLVEDLKVFIEELSKEYGVSIIEQECGKDHIHILFKCSPTINFKDYIQAVKGRSARYIRSKYADYLSSILWGKNFWSPSYFLATTGNVTIDILKKYVESQRECME